MLEEFVGQTGGGNARALGFATPSAFLTSWAVKAGRWDTMTA